jgi:zinc transport system permease protein
MMELFQYSFVQRALIAGILIALLAAVLGVFLVLRKLSLIGDGLSHVSFGGLAIGLALGILPTYAAIPVALLGSLLILKLVEHTRVYGDAAIGIVSAVGIAIGVVIASLGGGFNVDLMSYLFGNILAITPTELLLTAIVSAFVLLFVMRFVGELFAMTFDAAYARTLGIRTRKIDMMFFAVTSVVVVLAIQLVGVLLVSAMLILPAATALQLTRSFKGSIMFSSLIAVMSVLAGTVVSFLLNVPTGATIVLMSFAAFVIAAGTRMFLKQ